MIVNKISFTGKPDSFPSPKTRTISCPSLPKGWSSDDIGIVQYKMLKDARMKLRDAQTDVVLFANEKNLARKNRLKKEIRMNIENAIKAIDKVFECSTMKFYY